MTKEERSRIMSIAASLLLFSDSIDSIIGNVCPNCRKFLEDVSESLSRASSDLNKVDPGEFNIFGQTSIKVQ